MPDFPFLPPDTSEPPPRDESSAVTGFFSGLGIGAVLIIALVVLFAVSVPKYGHGGTGLFVALALGMMLGYLALIHQVAQGAEPESANFRTGLWVAAWILVGLLLLNPLSLCIMLSACN